MYEGAQEAKGFLYLLAHNLVKYTYDTIKSNVFTILWEENSTENRFPAVHRALLGGTWLFEKFLILGDPPPRYL